MDHSSDRIIRRVYHVKSGHILNHAEQNRSSRLEILQAILLQGFTRAYREVHLSRSHRTGRNCCMQRLLLPERSGSSLNHYWQLSLGEPPLQGTSSAKAIRSNG